jgi:hypothetical protein
MKRNRVRFVILRHDGIARPHFDLMIESEPGGPLETWRSDLWPIIAPTQLVHLPPHRRAYLDYEGPISNDRGQVHQVEAGGCTVEIGPEGRWTVTTQQWTLTLTPAREPAWVGDRQPAE